MARIPRYLPNGDYIPKDWPQGTGISLYRTAATPNDRAAIALVLGRFGCHPKVGLRAADAILGDEGVYDTRVRTATFLCRNLWNDLAEIGIRMEVEAQIPDGNTQHAKHPKNADRNIRSKRMPDDKVMEIIQQVLEAEANPGLAPLPGI